MKNPNELKPCPICGKPGAITTKVYSWGDVAYKPHCSNGSCLLWTVDKEYKTEDGAAKAWNRRSEEVKHGKWHSTGFGGFRCTLCGELVCMREDHLAKFCPECGAKMKNEEK